MRKFLTAGVLAGAIALAPTATANAAPAVPFPDAPLYCHLITSPEVGALCFLSLLATGSSGSAA